MAIVNLKTCNDSVEAHLIKNILENEHIECFLANENFSGLHPGMIGMMGLGVQVMLDEKDVEAALKLIDHSSDEQIIKCPYCDSFNILFGLGKNKKKKIAIALVSVFFYFL